MALRSKQPLSEMSTRNLPWGNGRPARKADNLTAICEPIVQKMWEPRRLTPLLASIASYTNSFAFLWEDLAVANITVQSQIICKGNEENHEKSQSEKS
jgi:hypothetical protein